MWEKNFSRASSNKESVIWACKKFDRGGTWFIQKFSSRTSSHISEQDHLWGAFFMVHKRRRAPLSYLHIHWRGLMRVVVGENSRYTLGTLATPHWEPHWISDELCILMTHENLLSARYVFYARDHERMIPHLISGFVKFIIKLGNVASSDNKFYTNVCWVHFPNHWYVTEINL